MVAFRPESGCVLTLRRTSSSWKSWGAAVVSWSQVRDLLLPGAPVRYSQASGNVPGGVTIATLLSSHIAMSVHSAFEMLLDALTMRALVAQETGSDPHKAFVVVSVALTQKVGHTAMWGWIWWMVGSQEWAVAEHTLQPSITPLPESLVRRMSRASLSAVHGVVGGGEEPSPQCRDVRRLCDVGDREGVAVTTACPHKVVRCMAASGS